MGQKPKLRAERSAGSTAKGAALTSPVLTDTFTFGNVVAGDTFTGHDDAKGAEPSSSPLKMNHCPTIAPSAVRKLGPCKKCGGPKNPKGKRGRHLCDNCEPTRPVRVCSKCGAPKPPGKGARLCDKCRGENSYNAPRPCANCGARTPKSHGKHLCPECQTYVPEVKKRRRAAKKGLERKPCRRCGRPKGPGTARQICDRCRDRKKPVRLCNTCKVNPVRPGYNNRLCYECKRTAVQVANQNARMRDKRRRETDPEYAERARELRRQSYERRKARQGSEMRRGKSLEGKPLALAVRQLVKQETGLNPFASHLPKANGNGGRLHTICERAGIADRNVTRWESGEGVSAYLADQVCSRLGLEWWNVWKLPPEMDGQCGSALVVLDYITTVEKAMHARKAFQG